MFLKRDPGPCPIDDAPHTTCCGGETTGKQILAGSITPATSVSVPGAPGSAMNSSAAVAGDTTSANAASTFTTTSYRGKRSRSPSTGAS